jgi:hypothetical protein
MKNTTTKHTKLTLIALAMSAVFLLPGVAGAAHDICADDMYAVETAINNANFTGKKAPMDRASMQQKRYHAEVKLSKGKFDDAIDKLMDISKKANALVGDGTKKSKLTDASASGINNAVDDAIACIAL